MIHIKILIGKLPPLHYKILTKLLHLLHAIATNSAKTSMGASNLGSVNSEQFLSSLAIVWTPNLLKSPSESLQTGRRTFVKTLSQVQPLWKRQ